MDAVEWLGLYATSRKVVASIPSEVIEFFKLPDTSRLRLTEPLIEIINRKTFLEVKRRRCVRLKTLEASVRLFSVRLFLKPSTACCVESSVV
jgi:hypothetical protein